jgi:hypothetical protein
VTESDGETRQEFWRQQPDETDYSYRAFAVYRDLWPARRLRRAAQIFYDRADSDCEPHQYDQLKKWSAAHLWADRVAAFDREQEVLFAQELEKARHQMIEDHIHVARLGLKAAQKKLLDVLRDEDGLSSGALPGLIAASANLHKMAVGEASGCSRSATRTPGHRSPTSLSSAKRRSTRSTRSSRS